jgi:hypothetical protein
MRKAHFVPEKRKLQTAVRSPREILGYKFQDEGLERRALTHTYVTTSSLDSFLPASCFLLNLFYGIPSITKAGPARKNAWCYDHQSDGV